MSSTTYTRSLTLFLGLYVSLLLLPSFLIAQPSAPDLDNVLVEDGFNAAVGVTFDASGVVYVWEKGGIIHVIQNGNKRATPLLDISDEVGNWRDFGLLGVAFDPNYLNNGYVYCMYVVDRHFLLNYNENNPPGNNYNPNTDEYFNATIGRITRYTVTNPSDPANSLADESTRHILIGDQINNGFPILHQSHGIGTLLFGEDGTLLASCGDGASYFTTDTGGPVGGTYTTQALADGIISSDENVGAYRSQLLSSLNGKVIRIDPATGDGIPSNPFYDTNNPDSHRSRVWLLGFRNPFRMTLRPNTGSHYAADGDPGTLYVGDVGWQTWDELDVAPTGGLNFGWPVFEGMEDVNSYVSASPENPDAPTPNGCGQSYYDFTDLIKQSNGGGGSGPFTDPCGGGTINSNQYDLFVHQKPAYASAHQQNLTKVSINGYVQNVGNGNANSVDGNMYPGNASVAGTWYVGNDLPVEYQNTYFHGDYSEKWIRNYAFDGNDVPTWVREFDTDLVNKGPVVCMASHPIHGGLYYIRYGGQLKQFVYNPSGNQSPTAVATSDTSYGPGPLTVQFDGSGSSDPEGQNLSYSWDFDDGNTSNQQNPTHIFNPGNSNPTQYNVELTVTDNGNNTDQTTIIISANNTPPVIQSTSIDNTDFYPYDVQSQIQLSANVMDTEHAQSSLALQWQVFLYHNDHNHPEPIVNADYDDVINTVLDPVGCDGNIYFYRVELTVSDPAGLSTFYYKDIYPNCGNTNLPPIADAQADTTQGTSSLLVNFDGTGSVDPDGTIASYLWDFDDGTTAGGATPSHTFGIGTFNVELTVTDDQGATGTDQVTIQVDGPNQNPVAAFSMNPSPGIVGQNISFDGSSSSDVDGTVVSYAWDFGDSNNDTGSSTNHAYADTGWYTVQLTVTDDDGATGQSSQLIRIDTVPPAPAGLLVEKGILYNVGDNWQTVNLSHNYTNMVVVTTVGLGSNALQPVVSRITNASGSSFDIRLQGFNGNPVSGYYVHYLVVEAGTYTLADDGVKMEAGTFLSTITAEDGNWATEPRTYQQSYSSPIVLGQVMSYNDPNWSSFWANGSSRQASPSATVFNAGKNVGEDPNTTRANETLGYIVFEAGTGTINGAAFEAGIGPDRIKGITNTPSGTIYPSSGLSLANPEIAIASMAGGMDASDGGWPVLMGLVPVTSSGITLAIDEDHVVSTERKHSTESIPFVVFEPVGNIDPTAVATADTLTGDITLEVNFDGSTSSDADGSIVSYDWDFGDGNAASGPTANHTFGPGTFDVVLTVTDDLGGTGTDTIQISVSAPNQAPTASFTFNPNPGIVGQSVSFDGSGSSDPDGFIASYAWDFGDGNNGTGATPGHTFADTGSYTVELTVMDDDGATHSYNQLVNVDTPSVSTGIKAEMGILGNVGDNWQTVNLAYTYTNMVVVTTPELASGAQLPVVTRITNSSGNSFDIRLQGFNGNTPSGYTVHYLVVEAGTYNETDDGVKMEAGTFTSTLTAGLNNWVTEARSYQQSYTDPIVIGQVMSYNDANWSSFWANGATRQAEPSPTVFNAGKNVGEDPNTSRANETIGYIVFEAGTGTLDGYGFEAGFGGDKVKGLAQTPNGTVYPPGGLTLSNPSVAITTMSGGMDATDGGWPVLFGPTPVTSSGITLIIDEDQVVSTERGHSTESLPYVVFESTPSARRANPEDMFVEAFPNPFHNYVSLEIAKATDEEVNVSIYNQLGQTIWTKETFESDIMVPIDPKLANGMYYIRAATETKMQVVRLMKE